MKKFYLLLILLVSGLGFGQVNLSGNATYALKISGQIGADGSPCGDNITRGLQWIASKDKNNTFKTIVQGSASYGNYGHGLTAQVFDPAIVYFKENERIEQLKISTTKRDRGNTGCKSVQYSEASISVTTDNYSQYYNFPDLALNQSGNIQINIYPIIDLTNPDTNNNIIGTESSILIPEIKGIDNKYFNWMFHIDGEGFYRNRPFGGRVWVDTWRSLPIDYQGVNSLDIKCIDFLPVEAVGKKVWLRANTNGKTVELLYAKSAPQINVVNAIQTRCFDTGDGRAIIKFNSKLVPGETLTCSILSYDETTGQEQGVYYSTPDGESIVIGNDLTYEIPYDFRKGKYHIKLLGWYKEPNKVGANTYIMDPKHQMDFYITSPTPVDFTISKKNDINCYGGSDGAIDIVGSGGIDNGIYEYSTNGGTIWKTFSGVNTTTINNLSLGICSVKVRKLRDSGDTVGCVAKKSDGSEKVLSEKIDQPSAALVLNMVKGINPTFNKAVNGSIIASISGGTLINGNSYLYEWKDSNNNIIDEAKSSVNFFNGDFTIILNNVPEGTYSLFIKDARNCIIDPSTTPSLVVTLEDPDPIVITLEQTQTISCNTENHDPILGNATKLSDGILKATVTGGIKFTGSTNNGLPYIFIWSKYNTNTSSWDVLTDHKTETAVNLSQGNYSLNVIDANEIVQGTYNSTDLETAIPTTKEVLEPAKLQLSFTSGNVSCHEGNNGWATANVIGGTGSYVYTWYNTKGGTIDENKISNLIAGTYSVEVTDKNGCSTNGDVVITEPLSPVSIDYEVSTPTFSGATNGYVIAKITNGTPFTEAENNGKLYNYEWKNSIGVVQAATFAIIDGIFTITLNDIPADDYFLTIKDKNYNEVTNQIINCSILEFKITLNEPDPLKVVFETVQTISCNINNEFGNDKDTAPSDGQRDESQDGILVAHVSGGTPLASSVNNGLPYFFNWKKQQPDGTWTNLAINNSIASNLSYGNYALNVEDKNHVILGSYTNGKWTAIDSIQTMKQPPVLSVKITKGDVFCYDGNDGWATATATGGSGSYTYEWSNEIAVANNTTLKKGDYWVIATDAKGCTAYAEIFIDQPIAPLSIKYTEVINPSFYKATDGRIVVEVTGGTIFSDNTYWYEWKNSKGIVQTSTTASFNNGIYTISLEGLPEDNYSLTVHDANYDAATNKSSCTVVNSITTLEDPDPLEVTFEVVRTISCNVSNEFGNETDATPLDNQRDESQDGILVAHVKGGIQLQADKNNGLPYYYTWKKLQKDGSWAIWNDNNETAEYISEGSYALNIEDANGIKLGTYVNNVLVKETDATHYMPEPAKLSVSFTKLDVGCTTGDDGWAEAHVSGGTPPYTYEWTNGETTSKIENITTNNYFVIATDAKGCIAQGSIFVGDPNGIFTTETIKNPICFNGNDGSIDLNVTGGNQPFSYLWSTGATTKDLNNLAAGNYEVSITCPDCCVYKKKFLLKDPEEIVVDLGSDRTLCNDQNLDLDATITDQKAQYSWTSTNGFTSNEAKVNISKTGTYHVKVTSGLGCISEDEVVIKTSQAAISSEFLLSSQAYLDEEVILINTSNPFGESTNWVIPDGVRIVEQKEKYITLKFNATGVYTIGLQQTQGKCYATYNKNITVEERSTLPNTDSTSQFILDFIVSPNPSDGNFKAFINLENISEINLRLFSTTGQDTMIQKKESGKKAYEVDFDTSLGSGIYVLVLETGQQTLVKKIIIY